MAAEPKANTSVFVSGFPNGITDDKIKQVIGEFGEIKSVKLFPGSGTNSATITFADLEEAKWFRENLDGNIPEGLSEQVKVRYSNPSFQGAGGGGGGAAGGWGPAASGGKGGQSMGGGPYGGQGMGGGKGMMGGKGMGGQGFGGGFGKGQAMMGFEGPKDSIQILMKGLRQAGVLPGGQWINDERCIVIKMLPEDTTNEDLFNMFSPFGAIANNGVKAMLTEDGMCKGLGFVNFLEIESASNATAALNGTMLPSGKILRVVAHDPNKGGGKKGAGDDGKAKGEGKERKCNWCAKGECWTHPGGKGAPAGDAPPSTD